MDAVEQVLLEIHRAMTQSLAAGEPEARTADRVARIARRAAALPPTTHGPARSAFLLLASREGEPVARLALHALGESALARPQDIDALLARRAFGPVHAAALRAVRDAVRVRTAQTA